MRISQCWNPTLCRAWLMAVARFWRFRKSAKAKNGNSFCTGNAWILRQSWKELCINLFDLGRPRWQSRFDPHSAAIRLETWPFAGWSNMDPQCVSQTQPVGPASNRTSPAAGLLLLNVSFGANDKFYLPVKVSFECSCHQRRFFLCLR